MINIVLMVHHAFTEHLLNGLFSRIPNIQVIRIPSQTSSKSFTEQTEAIQENILKSSLSTDDINFFIVESNYGKPADEGINTELLDFVLSQFPHARVIAYSGTTSSLANALIYNPAICAMDKSNNLDSTIQNICGILGQQYQLTITPRIYTTVSLKQLLQTFSETQTFGRERSGSYSPTPPPRFNTEEANGRQRRNTMETITPLYALSTSSSSFSNQFSANPSNSANPNETMETPFKPKFMQ
jgi:hypothetical protein